jgi:glycosyltransferase involved in cell wall biosynthesis
MSATASQLALAVPVFNAGEFLPATLASLNAQGPWLRWHLRDGGSTDRTVEIANAMKRSNDAVISEPDKGQADALNRAFAAMGGDIIGFINGDDMLTPGSAERVIEFFRLHPHIDLIYGCVEWVDRHGTVSGRHSGQISSLDEVLDIYNVWWRQRQWVQPEVFYRRTLAEKAGPFDTTLNLAFDYDFWVRCFRAGARVAHTPAVCAQFRLHASQKSVASERAADEIRTVVRRHLDGGVNVSSATRVRLRAALSYDLYQLGRTTPDGRERRRFLTALITHPHWLLSPIVRRRAQSSLAKLMPFQRRNGP